LSFAKPVMMIEPSAEELLHVWESNQRADAVHRGLAALATACPGLGRDAWALAPIGQRDNALFALQQALFGSELRTTATCPACGERVESQLSISEIVRRPLQLPTAPHRLHWQQLGYDIEYRLPNSEDLLAVAAPIVDSNAVRTADRAGNDAVMHLLRRCVACARHGDVAIDPGELPEDIVAGLSVQMEQHDPDADLRLALECPACAARWNLHFDIVSYFWGELDDWAQRTLADVHALASAYGWSEREILSISAQRRRLYLDMVGA
jgi:hypothetical protein